MMLRDCFFQAGKKKPDSWFLFLDCAESKGLMFGETQSGKRLFEYTWDLPERHSFALTEYFEKILNKVNFNELSAIIFVQGPGSFTGLRVGAAFIKTFGLKFNKVPIYGISKFLLYGFEIITNSKNKGKKFEVWLPSIGEKYFSAQFIQTEHLHWSEVIDFEGAKERVLGDQSFIKNGSKNLKDKSYLCAECVSQMFQYEGWGETYLREFTYLDLYPLYLRKSEAEEKARYGTKTI